MIKNAARLLALVFLMASFTVTIQSARASENSWITRPPMTKEAFVEVAVVNDKIYAIQADGKNEEYDPATLAWTIKETMPTPRGAPGIVVYQNKIYAIGGTNGFDPATGIPILCSVNEVYDPVTDTWENRKPMPTKRSALSANVVDGKIYLIGGLKDPNTGAASDLNEVYDPETDTWTTKKPIPTPVFSYASAVVESKIYVFSGSTTGQGTTNLTQIYDPATDNWSLGKPPLTAVTDAAAGATTGLFAPKRIYVIGGRTAATGISLNQVYDPETDQWTWGASMPTSRYNLAVAVVNDTLYGLGGVSLGPLQGTVYAVNELYIPFSYDGPLPPYWSPPPSPSPSPTTSPSDTLTPSPPSLGSWETMSPVPQGRLGPGVAAVNGKIYVIGGTGEGGYLNTNEEYDPATNTWTTKKPMPTPRSGFGIAVYQNKIYVIGGGPGGDWTVGFEEVTRMNEVYDPETDTWETKTPMSTAREFLCANAVNGKIYLIGGSKPVNLNDPSFVPNVNEVYDPETDSWASKTPPPVNVSSYASAVVDGKIYVISGTSASGSLTQIYDPETDSWSYGAPIPTPVWGAAAGVTSGVSAPKRIYVLGGYPAFSSNQIYDPETDSWATGAQMPTGRYGLGVAVVDDRLYAIGGSGYEAGRANERYTPVGYNSAALTEEPFPIVPVAVATVTAVVAVSAGLLVYFTRFRKATAKAEKTTPEGEG
jgi:N-acetylneuraminic acid mutarotase